ncbi:hypothetical protein IWX90DRAFT_411151 [Phyllosticta citrichinensis]|uniref:Uncharacterized protein n=1 Tax=Phyllosticta citrichinensis TaxID=1130410 RepID=A0ABR1Y8F3_9PEZI
MQDIQPQSRCSSSAARTPAVHFQMQRGGTDFIRPQQAERWWSCSAKQWRFFHATKDVKSLGNYHHAGRIMEDETCSIAAGPCSFCLQHGRECRTYNPQDAEVLGTRCAGCRVSNRSCSLVAIQDNGCDPIGASESAASSPDAVLSNAACTEFSPMPTRREGVGDEVEYLKGILNQIADLQEDALLKRELLSRLDDMYSVMKNLRNENEGLKGVVSDMTKEITALKGQRDENQDLVNTVSTLLKRIQAESESRSNVITRLVNEVSALKSHQSENESLKNIVSTMIDDMKAVKRGLRALEDGSNAGEVETMDDSY